MNRLSVWLTLLLLLLFGSMVAVAFQFPPEARLAPVVIGIPGIALCLLQLALDFGAAHRGVFAAARFHPAPKLGRPDEFVEEPAEVDREAVRRELWMWGYFLAFVATLLAFGFYVAVPAMLFAYLCMEARMKWKGALIAGIGTTTVVFFIFEEVFRFALFPGIVIPTALNAWGP